jgi:N-methylhydantoinase A/acetone carboxylase, beta subunit
MAKRGGTFTDCVGNPGTGRLEDDIVIKLLSEDPDNYKDAPFGRDPAHSFQVHKP